MVRHRFLRLAGVLPLVLSVGLLLALGGIALRTSGRAEEKAESVHRADATSNQRNLANLTSQYFLVAAKELLDYSSDRPFTLLPGADDASLRAFIERSALYDHGAVLVAPDGGVLSSYGKGLPASDDPGLAPLFDALPFDAPGLSSVVDGGGHPLVGVGIPVLAEGNRSAIFIGYWRADVSKLQEYNEQLEEEPHNEPMIVDSRGRLAAAPTRALVGTRLEGSPVVDRLPATKAGLTEFDRDGERMVAFFTPLGRGGWTLVKQVPSHEFYGPIRDSHGQATVSIVVSLAAAALLLLLLHQRTAATERRSDRRFRALVQNASDVVTLLDAEGRIVYETPAVERLLGYGPKERVGQRATLYLHPDHARWVETTWEGLLATPGDSARGDIRIRKADGSYCWLEVSIENMLHVPAVRGLVVNQRDISERRQAEEERRTLDAAKSEFLASAAHELRTPLTVLSGLASVITAKRHQFSEEELDECFRAFERNAGRVDSLISDLLDLAQIDRGGIAVELQPVEVAPAVRRALDACRPPDGVGVTLDLDERVVALADPGRLDQVLINLLTNAYKYGGTEVGVDVRPGAPDRVILAVWDSGPGVPDEVSERLFDPFVRGDSHRQVQGSGLGLAIVRRLVEAFGGSIRYERQAPTGARFVIDLPGPSGTMPTAGELGALEVPAPTAFGH